MNVKHAYRRASALLALVLACGGLNACSGSGDDSGDAAPTSTAAGEAVPFESVTIEHAYGETTIDEPPEKIVSLDQQWTDVLTAMDAPPVAHLVDPMTGEDLPWQEGLGDSTPLVAQTAADLPNLLEEILRIDPDLIVITYLVEDQAGYDSLNDIAPTIATLSESQVDTWQDIAEAAGQVLGQPTAAESVVTEVDDAVAAISSDLPGLEGSDYTFANYVPGDAMYVLSDPDDGANVLFGQLGLVIAPAILSAEDDSPGRVKLSLENVDLLDADLVVVLTNGATPEDIPGYPELPAVVAGASLEMDYETAVALNTPTPLSIPYGLDALLPALTAAAG